jgi:hypothetical protein
MDSSSAAERKEYDEKTNENALSSSRSSLSQKPENAEPLQPSAEAGDLNRDVERVVTTESTRKRRAHHGHVNDLSSVPNGGLRAWLQVAGSFFLFFNTW